MKTDQQAIEAARTDSWEVIGESSGYYEVAERLRGLVANTQTKNEIAYSPVCRVNKHIPAKRNLPLILAAPKMLAALRMAVKELNEIRARDGVPYTHGGWKASVDEAYFSEVVDACFAAIEIAESRTKGSDR